MQVIVVFFCATTFLASSGCLKLMANLKDIKRRIVSVKNTQKITHAMRLVSSAKFARANQAVIAARPYNDGFERMVEKIVTVGGDIPTRITEKRGQHKKELLVQ